MASITYRQLDVNNDPIWGQGSADFLSDIDAVAQAILTRIRLFEGEWWENLNEGTPLWQKILGVGGANNRQQQISLLLQSRILGTPYVAEITNLQVSFNAAQRIFNFYAVVKTQFGAVVVTNTPQPPLQGLP